MTENSNTGNHYRKQFTLKWQLKFIAMICFTGLLFVMKIVTGHITNSMALVADSFHMITDFAALTIGFIALRLANSKTSLNKNLTPDKFTFGWVRAEVLGGLINTVFLLALCFSILVHSLKRFIQPENITKPIPVLIVGVVSLVVNLLGLLMFRTSRENCWTLCLNCLKKTKKMKDGSRDNEVEGVSLIHGDQLHGRKCSHTHKRGHHEVTWEHEYQTPHSLNIRGVYLHILEHFLISIIVIFSAILMIHYEGEAWIVYIDPAFTLLVVATILYSTIPLFQETLILFMQSVPANIQVKDMEERLLQHVPEVLSVHEFHVWQLGGDQIVASAHLLYKQPEGLYRTLDKVKAFFQREGIACMTFQPEFLPKDETIMDASDHPTDEIMVSFDPSKCYSKCADKSCETMTCCSLEKEDGGDDGGNDHSHGAMNKGDCKKSRGNPHCKSSRNQHHVHHPHEEERCLVSPSSVSSTTECSLSPDRNSLTSFT